jgi:hypothetical protein
MRDIAMAKLPSDKTHDGGANAALSAFAAAI